LVGGNPPPAAPSSGEGAFSAVDMYTTPDMGLRIVNIRN
jgi:hypothetical protein